MKKYFLLYRAPGKPGQKEEVDWDAHEINWDRILFETTKIEQTPAVG